MSISVLPLSTAFRVQRRALIRLAVSAPILAWLSLATARESEPAAPAFRVVVNADNRASSITQELLASLFLKKVSHWDSGARAQPVDQQPSSAVRQHFSRSVLKRSVAAVRSYWQQRIFSGRGVPPPALDSDQAVISYVKKEKGAVGYVSPNAKIDGVKVLAVK
jgi:ABC-type phosphate transport system substrate-binding protein